MKKSLRIPLTIVSLSFAIIATPLRAQVKPATSMADKAASSTAAEKPDVNYITQTTTKITIPVGGTEKEMMGIWKEYFDKVIAKSTLVKHFTMFRHAWGSLGASIVITYEFTSWGDIDKYHTEEAPSLEKAAWPDEKARTAFLDKMSSYEDRYHRDEIYVVSNGMRK